MVSAEYPYNEDFREMVGETIPSRTYPGYHYEIIKQIGEGGVTEGVYMTVLKPDKGNSKPNLKPKICSLKLLR